MANGVADPEAPEKREDQIAEREADRFDPTTQAKWAELRDHPDAVTARDGLNTTPQQLQSLEDQVGGTSNANGAISSDDIPTQEESPTYKTNVTPRLANPEKKGRFAWLKGLKKRGPLSLIIGGIAGAGIIIALITSMLSLALVHIKEIAVNKLDSISSVVDSRGSLALEKRMFGTSKTCGVGALQIKALCKYDGLSQRQMDILEKNGAKLVDAEGNKLEKNALGRYTGGRKLILEGGEEIGAGEYKQALKRMPALRDLSRSVFEPRFFSWMNNIAYAFKGSARVPTDPKWGVKDDEKSTRQEINKAVKGESATLKAEETVQYKQNEDGSFETDKYGNKIPVTESPDDPKIDFGSDTDDINKLAKEDSDKAAAGESLEKLPSSAAEVTQMAEYTSKTGVVGGIKTGLGKIAGALNPLDIFTGLCTTYQLANITILAAKTISLGNTIRYAWQFVSTSDKIKDILSGGATPLDVEKAMNILQRLNPSGDAFGESFAYNYLMYGKITDIPLGASALGNDTIRTITGAMNTVNDAMPGGASAVRTACNILTNPFVVGGLALTSFIPIGGQVARGVSGVISRGIEEGATTVLKQQIEERIAKYITKDAIKAGSKIAARNAWSMAKGALGIFLAGYLAERYAVPYIARQVSGTTLTGDEDGATAMDAIATGVDASNSSIAQGLGLTPLHKDEYVAFNQFNTSSTASYVADMQAESNTLDASNPYSKISTIGAGIYPFLSKLNILNTSSSSLVSLPSAIMGSFSPSKFLSTTTYAASDDTEAELSYCQDDYLQNQNLATSPFCNVKYGFNDINMLNTADPEDVAQWMYDNKYIDDNGNPVSGSDFADFKSKCIDNTDGKYIGEIGDESKQIDKECYDSDKNNTEQYKMFRIYLIDGQISDVMDNGYKTDSLQCYPSSTTGSSSPTAGMADAATLDKLIEEQEGGTPGPMHGKGAKIIELSNQYGVNSNFIATVFLAETRFGADGSSGAQHNNFGWNKSGGDNGGDCGTFVASDGNSYDCYSTPDKGIEGTLKNITTNPAYKKVPDTAPSGTKAGSVAAVRNVYCPEGDGVGDGVCNLENFLKDSAAKGLTLNKDDPVFLTPGTTNTSGTSGGSTTSSTSTGTKISESELKQLITSYGLPEPKADVSPDLIQYGEAVKGYNDLAKGLTDNPKAAWAAQGLLDGEKTWVAKGGTVKQYLNTAWMWFENGQSAWPDPYQINCNDEREGYVSEVSFQCKVANFQVAGYQAENRKGDYTEVFKKLYSEDQLTSIMQQVVQNSSNASQDRWNYNDAGQQKDLVSSYLSSVGSATLNDIAPSGDFSNDPKTQFMTLVLGKDPAMAAALNSFAVSDDDLINALKGSGYGYIGDAAKQQLSNMIMALYMFDGKGPSGNNTNCPPQSSSERGTALPGWDIKEDPDIQMEYKCDVSQSALMFKHAMWGSEWHIVSQLHGPGNSCWVLQHPEIYAGYGDWAQYGWSQPGHPGYDISMPAGTKLYSPVSGTVTAAGGTGYFANNLDKGDAYTPQTGELRIQLSNGDEIVMGHMLHIEVHMGDSVTPGTYVGESGEGMFTGNDHLHLEYRKKDSGSACSIGYCFVDPTEYIP